MDPALRLFRNCRTMLPLNTNVPQGEANGTQTTFQKLVLKPGTVPKTVLLSNGIPVKAIFASQVDYVILHHTNDRINPQSFTLKPTNYTFKANILKPMVLQSKGEERETIVMKATQLPLIINNATTGHKLQGTGVDDLFVHSWRYVTNWPYVMLSRVKTHKGLYLRKELSRELKKYRVPDGLKRMLARLRNRSPTYWTDEEYEELFL